MLLEVDVMNKVQVVCPCCEASMSVDTATGSVISYDKKEKHLGSFEDLRSELDKKSELRNQLFSQEQQAQKDRARILDEKFKEALKKADTDSDEPFRNPLDYD